MKVVITPRPFASKGLEQIEKMKSLGYDVIYNDLNRRFSKEELLDYLKDADALITGNDDLSKEVLMQAPYLKVIAKYGVGVDNIDCEYCNDHGIEVCKAIGANSISVAEMTIQLILAASRHAYTLYDHSKHHIDERIMGREVYGKTLAILGMGAIGRHVANVCDALGMNIIAYDPYVNEKEVEPYVTLTNFDTCIQEADYISLHLPLLESTKHILDSNAIEKMKKQAVIVNTARGGLVDEEALWKALSLQRIAFAAEDVELKERSQKLVACENYIIVPHAASFTEESDEHTIQISSTHVLRVLQQYKED